VNIEEYISSGIIESYVLGLASQEERAEFEQLCFQYPELAEARNNFELAIEQKARQGKITPPLGMKDKIWSAVQQSPSPNTPKIMTMESTSTRRSSGLRWVAAASIILLFLTGYLAYDLYNKNKELKSSNKDLKAQIDQMAEGQKLMHDPNTTVVNLVGLKGSPSSANIYWDSTSPNVYLIIKNMPLLPTNKQYQLWALIDNKPVDLGLFDAPTDNKVILKMKNIQKADAFAITVENRGNTGGPTLDQLKALGRTRIE
jgi:anti-sigma-K factor RskA